MAWITGTLDGVPAETDTRRRRDAADTRRRLLEAARHRFAAAGYAATTVREIADDAGVNVALINRYFSSKEGLFEQCLTTAVDELRQTTGDVALDDVPLAIAQQLAGMSISGQPYQLALMLRSSGDERADEIRIGVLRTSSERLAAAAGWHPRHPQGDQLLLRAQIVLSAAVGMALLRSSTKLEPLGEAGIDDLVGPLADLIRAVLPVTKA
ncbi:TetR/AcrR family transcriptional regulator [Hamadaea tsunoensis]|uniref:TetR/AcrR family transcriptional regulator n=1 Tax=Hamadaea tsunoensis TaxID=53368 RepID=UPI000424E9B4|nr:TetR/AcrR family transcriptional regulator [Hamadaea tsunoensis]